MNDIYPMTFTGTEIGFLDDHGRLVLPQVWREALADRTLSMILLSDGEDVRLVVYPCPTKVPGEAITEPYPALDDFGMTGGDTWTSVSPIGPEPTPDWGDLPPRGQFVYTVDPKGRFYTPVQFHKHCPGKQILLKGFQDHFVVTPHERLKEGVDTIKGVREYLWPETDILFVQDRLPCEGTATPLFGPAARKVWRSLYEVGLVTRLFIDPLVAEERVFGTGQCITGNRRLSIMTFSWNSGTLLNGSRQIWFGDWERINKVCATLKAKKLAYLGKKLATEGGRDWSKSGMKPPNPFGYLREHSCDGHPVRLYGLPLTNIGPESERYFQALNDTVKSLGTLTT